MTTEALSLGDNFYPCDVVAWYTAAALGDRLTIRLPNRSTAVQLIYCPHEQVHW